MNFKFIKGDISNLKTCELACKNIDYVLHQAALGSVPRSINDPILSNEVNVNGFLNIDINNVVKKGVYNIEFTNVVISGSDNKIFFMKVK